MKGATGAWVREDFLVPEPKVDVLSSHGGVHTII